MRQFFYRTWTAPAPRRPAGVTILALACWLLAPLWGALAVAGWLVSRLDGTGLDRPRQLLILLLLLALSVAQIGMGVGLLRLNRRAHQAAVALLGLSIAGQWITIYEQRRMQFAWIGAAALLAYLLLPRVRQAFASPRESPASRPL